MMLELILGSAVLAGLAYVFSHKTPAPAPGAPVTPLAVPSGAVAPVDKPGASFETSADGVVFWASALQPKLAGALAAYHYLADTVSTTSVTLAVGPPNPGQESALDWALRMNSNGFWIGVSRWVLTSALPAQLVASSGPTVDEHLGGKVAILATPNQLPRQVSALPPDQLAALVAKMPGLAAALQSIPSLPGYVPPAPAGRPDPSLVPGEDFDADLPADTRSQLSAIVSDRSPSATAQSSVQLEQLAAQLSTPAANYPKTARLLRKEAAGRRASEAITAVENGGFDWTIRTGDLPGHIAQFYTGNAGRAKEIYAANQAVGMKPTKTGVTGWTVGTTVKLPASWAPFMAKGAPAPLTAATPAPHAKAFAAPPGHSLHGTVAPSGGV